MNWLQLAGSLAAILSLAGIAWAMKLGRGGHAAAIEDPESAAQAAEEALPGFQSFGALVGEDRAAAIVAGHHGRVAVVKRHGARLAAREVRWDRVRATHEGMLVETGDRRFGAVTVVGVNVLDIRRLAPSLTSV
ncbi:hypothetical protein EAH87_08245 [Sphingomonas koreensis]|nr:hypothetical protein EAH87_08245 [Sphingomonas koreensis]